jgi:hypothetical protein
MIKRLRERKKQLVKTINSLPENNKPFWYLNQKTSIYLPLHHLQPQPVSIFTLTAELAFTKQWRSEMYRSSDLMAID